jgi:pimeloyl-ACP methyl ester carboxylesterase
MKTKLLLKFILFVDFALMCNIAFAQEYVVKLYDGAAPGSENWAQKETTIEYLSPFWNEKNLAVFNVVDPTLTIFLPAPEKATGSAIVVCPGGGFSALSWDTEGPNVAKWLAEHGVAAFVLKYRISYSGATREEVNLIAQTSYGGQTKTPEALALIEKNKEISKSLGDVRALAGDDGRRAIEYIRKNANKWNINPDKIGMIGFSAGGMLTLNIAFNHTDQSKPNIIGVIYGAMGFEGVPKDPMPMFMAASQYEATGGAASLYASWCGVKLPAEIHSFTDSRHGFGYRKNDDTVNVWIELFYNFMKKTGFIQ